MNIETSNLDTSYLFRAAQLGFLIPAATISFSLALDFLFAALLIPVHHSTWKSSLGSGTDIIIEIPITGHVELGRKTFTLPALLVERITGEVFALIFKFIPAAARNYRRLAGFLVAVELSTEHFRIWFLLFCRLYCRCRCIDRRKTGAKPPCAAGVALSNTGSCSSFIVVVNDAVLFASEVLVKALFVIAPTNVSVFSDVQESKKLLACRCIDNFVAPFGAFVFSHFSHTESNGRLFGGGRCWRLHGGLCGLFCWKPVLAAPFPAE